MASNHLRNLFCFVSFVFPFSPSFHFGISWTGLRHCSLMLLIIREDENAYILHDITRVFVSVTIVPLWRFGYRRLYYQYSSRCPSHAA